MPHDSFNYTRCAVVVHGKSELVLVKYMDIYLAFRSKTQIFGQIPCVCRVYFVALHRNVIAVKFIAIKFYEEVL